MLDKTEIHRIINKITSSEYYEGDFGDRIENTEALLKDIEKKQWVDVPSDYVEFLTNIGFGELDAAFYLDDGPVPYETIFRRKIDEYYGMYVFAGNSSEVLYAFDAENGWSVVSLDSETMEVEKVADSFAQFIMDRLKYIEELVELRLDD